MWKLFKSSCLRLSLSQWNSNFVTIITFVINKQLIINKYLSKMKRSSLNLCWISIPFGTDIMFEVCPKRLVSMTLYLFSRPVLDKLLCFSPKGFENHVCSLNSFTHARHFSAVQAKVFNVLLCFGERKNSKLLLMSRLD